MNIVVLLVISHSLLSILLDGLVESSIEGIPVFVAVALSSLLGVHEHASLAILSSRFLVEIYRQLEVPSDTLILI